MRIIIERNELIYIYLLELEHKFGMIDKTHAYINGQLLIDMDGNWIGVSIQKINEDQVDLNKISIIDEIIPKCYIFSDSELCYLFFNSFNTNVHEVYEQDFNLDIISEGLYGIEIILSSVNKLVFEKSLKKIIENKLHITHSPRN